MLSLTLDEVKNFLASKNYEIQYQKETNQLYTLLKVEGHDFPLFLRVYDEGDLLQLILFIPTTIQQSAFGDLARLLHTLNKEIDIPGFGMDESSKVAFYRIMIPAINKKIDSNLIEMFMATLPTIADSFAAVIMTAATGAATFDQIMKKMEQLKKEQP